MTNTLPLSLFLSRYPDENACLEEIKKQRYPKGIYCISCSKITRQYQLSRGAIYSCNVCRRQTYPLAGTLFEKSSTPLRTWFLALYLMTQTRDNLSIKQLQRELGVTYKTAWRIHKQIRLLMEQQAGDLLKETIDNNKYKEHRWVFFNKLEISWIEKQESKE